VIVEVDGGQGKIEFTSRGIRVLVLGKAAVRAEARGEAHKAKSNRRIMRPCCIAIPVDGLLFRI
jgi:hypothetical protein